MSVSRSYFSAQQADLGAVYCIVKILIKHAIELQDGTVSLLLPWQVNSQRKAEKHDAPNPNQVGNPHVWVMYR